MCKIIVILLWLFPFQVFGTTQIITVTVSTVCSALKKDAEFIASNQLNGLTKVQNVTKIFRLALNTKVSEMFIPGYIKIIDFIYQHPISTTEEANLFSNIIHAQCTLDKTKGWVSNKNAYKRML